MGRPWAAIFENRLDFQICQTDLIFFPKNEAKMRSVWLFAEIGAKRALFDPFWAFFGGQTGSLRSFGQIWQIWSKFGPFKGVNGQLKIG